LAVKVAGIDERLADLEHVFEALTGQARERVSTDKLEPRVRLLGLMIQAFNLDELMELCFAVGLFWDQIPGDTLTRKAQGMIEALERNGRLYMLVSECQQRRPKLSWPTL